MRIDAVKRALNEAKRFQMAAVRYVQKDKEDSFAQYGCKESGALKRASMDLTRALAELRKP